MNNREQALLAYFFTIAAEPRVRASRSARELKDAVLACIAEDLPAVARHAFRGAAARVEAPVREGARTVASAVFGGSMPPRAAEHATGIVDEVLNEGFRWFENLIEKGRKSAR